MLKHAIIVLIEISSEGYGWMDEIKKKRSYYRTALYIGVFTIATVIIYFHFLSKSNGYSFLFGLIAIVGTICVGILLFLQNKRLRMAQLIIENQILHIKLAVIETMDGRNHEMDASNNAMEVFLSCFGALLGCRVIQFNQEGVRLMAIEIGQDSIFLTYGTDERSHRIKLLHPTISQQEIEYIVEKFRYETGIKPTVNREQGGDSSAK